MLFLPKVASFDTWKMFKSIVMVAVFWLCLSEGENSNEHQKSGWRSLGITVYDGLGVLWLLFGSKG